MNTSTKMDLSEVTQQYWKTIGITGHKKGRTYLEECMRLYEKNMYGFDPVIFWKIGATYHANPRSVKMAIYLLRQKLSWISSYWSLSSAKNLCNFLLDFWILMKAYQDVLYQESQSNQKPI